MGRVTLTMRHTAAAGLLAALGATLVAWVDRLPVPALPIAAAATTRLDPTLRAKLAQSEESIWITYFVSRAAVLPSPMRRVRARVLRTLEMVQRSARAQVHIAVVDPDADEANRAYAARLGIAPQRLARVHQDGYTEARVYSSVVLRVGESLSGRIDGIDERSVSRLQARMAAVWSFAETPPRARLQVVAPAGYDELIERCKEWVQVEQRAPDAPLELAHCDALFIAEPRRFSGADLVALRQFLERGGSVLVCRADPPAPASDPPSSALPLADPAFAALARSFGVEISADRLLDPGTADALTELGERMVVRAIAPHQDFRSWSIPPNGDLYAVAPQALYPDAERLAENRREFRALSSTSDRGVEVPWDSWTAAASGRPVAKRAWIAELAPHHAAEGSLLLASSSAPFRDGLLDDEGTAHARLLRGWVERASDRARLVLTRTPPSQPDRLEPLAPTTRALCRGLALSLPLLCAGIALWRRVPRARARRWPRIPLWFALSVIALLVAAEVLDRRMPPIDTTRDRLHSLAPQILALIERASLDSTDAPLRLYWAFSPPSRLPPTLRPRSAQLRHSVRRWAEALARAEQIDIDVGELGAEELAEFGITTWTDVVQSEQTTELRRFHAALILERGERREIIEFPDIRDFEEAEFRFGFALWRLCERRSVRVGFASDVPRPSAAEAYEHYQTKGLMPPKGSDVYSVVRRWLARSGFQVVHIDPRDPELPGDLDALLWLQPRRPVEPMLEVLARHLHEGGRAFVAAQHFSMQALQFRGAGFQVHYWPEPQFPDLDLHYLPELGLELVREVVFDESTLVRTMDTRIHGRSAHREFERQEAALAFQLRALAENFCGAMPWSNSLGDQAFSDASELRVDQATLERWGLRAQPLLTTTDRSWTFPWTAGWLPPEVMEPPTDRQATRGRTLALAIDGTFPRAQITPDGERSWKLEHGSRNGERGRLLLLGCSSVFRDATLESTPLRGDRLLLAAAADLTLPDELLALLERRAVIAGFASPAARGRWFARATTVAGLPLVCLAAAVLVSLRVRGRARGTARTDPGGRSTLDHWTTVPGLLSLSGALMLLTLLGDSADSKVSWTGGVRTLRSEEDRPVAALRLEDRRGERFEFVRRDGAWWRHGPNPTPADVQPLLAATRALREHAAWSVGADPASRERYGLHQPLRLDLCGVGFFSGADRDVLLGIELGHAVPEAPACYLAQRGSEEVLRMEVDGISAIERALEQDQPFLDRTVLGVHALGLAEPIVAVEYVSRVRRDFELTVERRLPGSTMGGPSPETVYRLEIGGEQEEADAVRAADLFQRWRTAEPSAHPDRADPPTPITGTVRLSFRTGRTLELTLSERRDGSATVHHPDLSTTRELEAEELALLLPDPVSLRSKGE